MDLSKRLKAFEKLGRTFKELSKDTSPPFLEEAVKLNPWFTEDFIKNALAALARNLENNSLEKWISSYPELEKTGKPKRIGVIMAGNIPLVGFHDMIAVLTSGNIFVGKPSSKDGGLHKIVADLLISIEPAFKDYLFISEKSPESVEAIIATGSDNSARYFEYHYRDIPHLIRNNRNSIAILDGNETREELKALATDIFEYFGLGCRNVSKLLIPQNYPLENLFEAWEGYKWLVNHQQYRNNYFHSRAILQTEGTPFFDSGFFLFEENHGLSSPIATVFFQYYSATKELLDFVQLHQDQIQCMVTQMNIPAQAVKPGQAQYPDLWDYADNIDTLKFLL